MSSSFNNKGLETPSTTTIVPKPPTTMIKNQLHPVRSTTTVTMREKTPAKCCHAKVDCQGRRIYILAKVAAQVFQLTSELEHKRDGQTIEWLLHEVKPAITNVLRRGSTFNIPKQQVAAPVVAPPLACSFASGSGYTTTSVAGG